MSVETVAFGNRHTPEQILLDALQQTKHMKTIVLVYMDNDRYVHSAWSQGMSVERIGLLELAKLRQVELMQEADQQEAGDGD